MGLEAGNPVVGGTVLRRSAIQSPGFVHSLDGWAIKQDGTAEFQGLLITNGTFTSVSPFGSGFVQLEISNAEIVFSFSANANGPWVPGPQIALGSLTTPASLQFAGMGTTTIGTLAFVLPSFDHSGITDSANINSLLASGLTPWLLPGDFYLSTTIQMTSGQYIYGCGEWLTFVHWVSSTASDCFRAVDTTNYLTRTVHGGGIKGLTLDGQGATSGSPVGIHIGDILQWEIDVGVQNFSQPGSIGVFFDNQNFWTEQLKGRIFVENCRTAVYFSCGGAVTSTGSYDRMILDIFMIQNGGQNGVIFDNGAVGSGRLGIYGNMNAGPGGNAVLQLIGQTPAGHALSFSGLGAPSFGEIELNIDIECNGSGTTPPETIFFGGPNNFLVGHGALNFQNGGGGAFVGSSNTGQFQFTGTVSGDDSLPCLSRSGSSFQTISANGQVFSANRGSVLNVDTSAARTGMIVAQGLYDGQLLDIINVSGNTLTMAASGVSNVANGVSCVVPALAGITLRWNESLKMWFQT